MKNFVGCNWLIAILFLSPIVPLEAASDGAVSDGAVLDRIATSHFIPAADWANVSRYRCSDSRDGHVDVEVAFGRQRKKIGGGYEGSLSSITFYGKKASSASLEKINAAVAGRTIESVFVSCRKEDIKMVLRLWGNMPGETPSQATTTSITVVRAKDGALDIR